MTRSSAILAVADDLTGAAEIAAVGHRAGWPAEVVTRWSEPRADALTVLDTDTRLSRPDAAARALSLVGRSIAEGDPGLVFKKTDSVLRGPVLAEVTALAAALGRTRVLLVPANPSLGRVIRDGRYFVNGAPLHETAFAHDPHHPARTAEVAALLGPGANVLVCTPSDDLPSTGVIVGATASGDDVAAWARRVDSTMLPAGGRDFFTAMLRASGLAREGAGNTFAPARPTLLVRGSLASPTRAKDVLELPALAAAGNETALDRWIEHVLTELETSPFVAVACGRSDAPQAPTRIRAAFAELVRRAIQAGVVRHVMVEGGATAASILNVLGWQRLAVVREWVPGVATLRPVADEHLAVTMKPGSYVWPDELWSHVNAN